MELAEAREALDLNARAQPCLQEAHAMRFECDSDLVAQERDDRGEVLLRPGLGIRRRGWQHARCRHVRLPHRSTTTGQRKPDPDPIRAGNPPGDGSARGRTGSFSQVPTAGEGCTSSGENSRTSETRSTRSPVTCESLPCSVSTINTLGARIEIRLGPQSKGNPQIIDGHDVSAQRLITPSRHFGLPGTSVMAGHQELLEPSSPRAHIPRRPVGTPQGLGSCPGQTRSWHP